MGLYDFFETDDGALLACVYNTDADGNKKFGAVKIASADIDLDKNGAYIENGEIRYYVNGKVSSDYTGMAVDAEGHKYWFDNGTAARINRYTVRQMMRGTGLMQMVQWQSEKMFSYQRAMTTALRVNGCVTMKTDTW